MKNCSRFVVHFVVRKAPTDVLGQLYALFKVANGEDISKATAPGMFDLKVLQNE